MHFLDTVVRLLEVFRVSLVQPRCASVATWMVSGEFHYSVYQPFQVVHGAARGPDSCGEPQHAKGRQVHFRR